MIRMTFYDYLKEELIRGGLWEWSENRTYREVIVKPEILFAHERAWKRFCPIPPIPTQPTPPTQSTQQPQHQSQQKGRST